MSDPFIVVIAGGSCSGKSTLAEALKIELTPLSRRLLSMDSYMLQEGGPCITLSTGERCPNNNHPDSTDNAKLLADLASVEADIVLIEGLMALHLEEIRTRSRLRIFVELSPEARTVRRMVRSIKRLPDRDPEWIGRYFLECAVVGHREYVEPSRRHADLIVAGDGDTKASAALLATFIKGMV